MWDRIELWLRNAGGPLALGVLGCFLAADAQLLVSRVLYVFMGVAGVMECWTQTRKLIRSREATAATLDREVPERAETSS
ncbi:hypothetical protein ACF09C_34480 [Streptomyces sp. NPDC014870]|uniref:hypothetical protein n=1 Tax=Streptomyces sp. NPDC014870 TaxID=3364925 RepID=UPI0036F537D9